MQAEDETPTEQAQVDPWTVWLLGPRDHDTTPPRAPLRLGMGLFVGVALAGFWGSAATVAWRSFV